MLTLGKINGLLVAKVVQNTWSFNALLKDERKELKERLQLIKKSNIFDKY